MSSLWLLRGGPDAPGWRDLERDSKEDKVDLVIFDRAAWGIVLAEEAPTQYEGLVPEKPADGMYVSEQGYPIYVVNQKEVSSAIELLHAFGEEGRAMLEKTKDPDTAIQRLGKAY